MIFENMDRIVFAGDSVTDMERARPLGEGLFDNLGRSYVRVVDNMLGAWYPEILVRVTNAGVAGNTSRDLLARFQAEVVDLHPDWVSILIGMNDVWRQFDTPAMPDYQVQPEEYRANVEQMLQALQGKVKGVFLMTPYYLEPNQEDWMRSRMNEYGQICRELAGKYGCILVDLQEAFDRYFQYRHSAFIAWDRIHPNLVGATVIAKEFLAKCDFHFQHIPEKQD